MRTSSRRALIVGNGVGGMTLAFWLLRAGWSVEVISKGDPSPQGREARLDLRGAAGEVVSRMGLAEAATARGLSAIYTTYMTASGRVVAAGNDSPDGTTRPGVWITEDHLCALIQEACGVDSLVQEDHVEAVGTSASAVHAYCHNGRGDEGYDVLVVADGMYSSVRALTMERDLPVVPVQGELTRFTLAQASQQPLSKRHRRHYTAGRRRSVTVESAPDGRSYVEMFHLPPTPLLIEDRPVANQKATIAEIFDDVGWGSLVLRGLLETADDFTHQSFRAAEVHGPWWHGRSVLLGDAAHGRGAADGSGTSLDIVGAYVLAGELVTRSDPAHAFMAYESFMRPVASAAHARRSRRLRQTHPRTSLGLHLLHRRHALMLLRPCELRVSAADAGAVALPPFPDLP